MLFRPVDFVSLMKLHKLTIICVPYSSKQFYGKFIPDIDECKTPFLCGPKGKCINTPGSYRCECPPGVEYKLPEKFCVGKLEVLDRDNMILFLSSEK